MTTQILIVFALTFIIHLISTLSYSVRIVGIRTKRIAISFALFNVMVLISRTANGFQAPLLASQVEKNIKEGLKGDLSDFRFILLAATLATIIGGVLIPTFQRVLSKSVHQFSIHKSIPKLLIHGFSKSGIIQFRDSLKIPDKKNVSELIKFQDIPKKIFFMNILAVSILTVGVLASLYAGYLNPDLRATSSTLTSVINGSATILMFIFIDPYLSGLTDDVVIGKCSEVVFRKFIIWMVVARLIGTLIAQIIFVPAAEIIAAVANMM
ncbi:MAG: hypothetical protein ACI94Y_001746 [Maribacter sp.]|jgi:hypothetical protein